MAKKKKAQLDHEYRAIRLDRIARVIETAIKYGSLATCAWFASSAVASLSGETTFAQFGLGIFGNMTVTGGLQITVTTTAIFYGLRQRQLRRTAIKQLAPFAKEHELRLDPKRSSSLLADGGTTRREDRMA